LHHFALLCLPPSFFFLENAFTSSAYRFGGLLLEEKEWKFFIFDVSPQK
jgi:hypothetical protein